MDDAAGGEGEEDQNWVACDCCLKWRTAAYSFDATRCFLCATAGRDRGPTDSAIRACKAEECAPK